MNFSPLSYVYTLLHRDRKWAKKNKKYTAVHASGTNAFVKATPSPTSMHMWVNKSLHTHIHTNHLGHPFGSSSSSEIQILLLPYHDVHFLPGQLCLVSCLEKKKQSDDIYGLNNNNSINPNSLLSQRGNRKPVSTTRGPQKHVENEPPLSSRSSTESFPAAQFNPTHYPVGDTGCDAEPDIYDRPWQAARTQKKNSSLCLVGLQR